MHKIQKAGHIILNLRFPKQKAGHQHNSYMLMEVCRRFQDVAPNLFFAVPYVEAYVKAINDDYENNTSKQLLLIANRAKRELLNELKYALCRTKDIAELEEKTKSSDQH